MNLNNFEKKVEPKIIDRGFSYYEQDAINNIEEVDKYEFEATVYGSDEYEVYIRLDKNQNILEHSCDCPYDWGNVCKHEVAVMYYLKDTDFSGSSFREAKVEVITKALKKLSKNDLIDIMVEMSKENRAVKEAIWEELNS
ncbi:MAG: SWIM zinc finger family protein [Saprospiraceae bacterium]